MSELINDLYTQEDEEQLATFLQHWNQYVYSVHCNQEMIDA